MPCDSRRRICRHDNNADMDGEVGLLYSALVRETQSYGH